MSTTTIIMLALYFFVLGGGSLFMLYKVTKGKRKPGETVGATGERFGSSMGFILSTLGMSVGVGVFWRFPMMCAQWGGGAFVVAYTVICLFIAMPAGWAELAYGRHFRKGTVGCGAAIAGGFGKAYGWTQSIVSLCVWSYYPAIMALILIYMFKTFKGLDSYAGQAEAVYEATNDQRFLVYGLVLLVLLMVAYVGMKGITAGIERWCKFLLPILFVFMIILAGRMCMIPGITEGIEYYIKPDWAQLANPKMWVAAAGTALFAVGVGPGCLLVYGRFVRDEEDIATDFITVNLLQLFICILGGFIIIPAVKIFGLDPLMGKGIMFVALPQIFATIPGGDFFFILFCIVVFFAGMSSSMNQLEIASSAFMDEEGFGFSRKKATMTCFVLAALFAVSCTWNDAFFEKLNLLAGNFGYMVTAFILVILVGWKYGAKKAREEWYLPSSAIKWGSWVDFLYKYIVLIVLGYGSAAAFLSLFY